MRGSDSLDRFLGRVRRRHISNLAFSQLSVAVTVLLAGVVMLLFLGTQIFDWRWIAALVVISVAFGAWRLRRRLIGDYALAQLADRRLALSDSLSTAWFFRRATDRGSLEMRTAQRELAEAALRSADAKAVVRLSFPKVLYAAGALAVLAFAMVAIRYGSYQGLALRAPLAPVVAGLLQKLETPQRLAQTRKPADVRRGEKPWEESGSALDPSVGDRAEDDTHELATAGERDARTSSGVKSGEPKDSATVEKIPQPGQGSEDASGEQGSEAGDPANSGDHNQSGQQTGPPRNGGQPNAPGRQAAAQSNQPGSNSNLMSKVRDAMSNLLSKLNGRSQQGGRQQSDPAKKGFQQAEGKQGGSSSTPRQDGGRSGSQREADSQGEAQQQAQAGNGQNSPKPGASRQGATDPNSGAGHQDGSKDLAAAQQLAAMGKISEILGRRSRGITGEITVEVNSGHQRLQTAYTHNRAGHTEASGEIHRDEVPLALQAYVQQYFEQIRRSPEHAKQR